MGRGRALGRQEAEAASCRTIPYEVDDLKAGARVEVDEGSLFDYLYRRADGTDEGGETTKILMAREKR